MNERLLKCQVLMFYPLRKKSIEGGGRVGGGCILPPLYVRGLKGLMIRVLILIEEIFYSLETMKVAVIVIVALLSYFQASPVGHTHSVISSNGCFFLDLSMCRRWNGQFRRDKTLNITIMEMNYYAQLNYLRTGQRTSQGNEWLKIILLKTVKECLAQRADA